MIPQHDILIIDGDHDRDHPAPKPATDPTRWHCQRCDADVVDGYCHCSTSPSPWVPVPAS